MKQKPEDLSTSINSNIPSDAVLSPKPSSSGKPRTSSRSAASDGGVIFTSSPCSNRNRKGSTERRGSADKFRQLVSLQEEIEEQQFQGGSTEEKDEENPTPQPPKPSQEGRVNNRTLLDEMQESEGLEDSGFLYHDNDILDITVGVEMFEDDGEEEEKAGHQRKKSTASVVSVRTCGTIQTEKVNIGLNLE